VGGLFPLGPEGKDNIGSVWFLPLWAILRLFSSGRRSIEWGSSDGIRWAGPFRLISFDCWGRTIDEPLSLLIVTNTREEWKFKRKGSDRPRGRAMSPA